MAAAERTAAVPGARAAGSELARAAFAVGVACAPIATEELLVRRAAAYLFGDASLGRVAVLVHVASAIAFAVVAARARLLPPWRTSRLLLLLGAASTLVHVGALFAFADARVFPAFVVVSGAIVGALLGALAATAARHLRGIAIAWDPLLDRISPLSVLAAILLGVSAIALAARAGPMRTGAATGIVCALVAHLGGSLAPRARGSIVTSRLAAGVAYVAAGMLVLVDPIAPWLETPRLPDPLVFAHNEGDSRIVLTSGRGAFQLWVDGLLRMSTLDGDRRREALVEPVMAEAKRRERVLVIGGGDGIAARQVLSFPDVREVTIVEPEHGLVEVARTQPILLRESAHALSDPRVRIIEADPLPFLRDHDELFDVAIVDVLEPDVPRRSKLTTSYFYRLLVARLRDDGVAVVSALSPFSARRAFWCIDATLRTAGFATLPYRASLPSIGVAGFFLAAKHPIEGPKHTRPGLAYVDDATLSDMFALAPDEARVDVEPNLLHRQVIVRYREEAMP